MRIFNAFVFAFFAAGLLAPSAAAEGGSADDAVALTKKAVAYVNENGKDKAFAEFSNPAGRFRDRELYVTALDLTGKNLAHGGNPKLIGKSTLELKDMDGKYFVKEFIDVANKKGKGWVDYKWPNPVTRAIEQKSTYVEKIDDFVITCGIYKRK